KDNIGEELLNSKLSIPNQDRVFYIKYAFEKGMSVEEISSYTKIDPWFLFNIKQLVDFEKGFKCEDIKDITKEKLFEAKKLGYSDVQIAYLCNTHENKVRALRSKFNIKNSILIRNR
ncbi:unnamed protein product, partial [marine sediment metagenome]